ncbi:MAG: hypothetical protein Lokiarch_27330, partial [Candidatus Lokiarchaeum sp. GC14_75]
NVTGTEDDSLVNIQVSGGASAMKLITIMEKIDYIEKQE